MKQILKGRLLTSHDLHITDLKVRLHLFEMCLKHAYNCHEHGHTHVRNTGVSNFGSVVGLMLVALVWRRLCAMDMNRAEQIRSLCWCPDPSVHLTSVGSFYSVTTQNQTLTS